MIQEFSALTEVQFYLKHVSHLVYTKHINLMLTF